MIVTSLYDYKRIKRIHTSNLIRIFFDKKNSSLFYLSDKQYLKLVDSFEKNHKCKIKDSYVIAVFNNDDERFVWSGIENTAYSDREFLLHKFNAQWSYNYYINHKPQIINHIPVKINISIIEPINELKR